MAYQDGKGVNAITNTHEMRFLNIYTLLSIFYYVLLFIVIIVLAIKAVGFLKARQTFSNIFVMHYG